jgi:hypothetical protein
MRNTTFENFPIAITLGIPTYNTHALQLQNPIVTTQQLHHRSNQGICMSWHIILIYIYKRESHKKEMGGAYTSGVRSVGFLSWPENIERVCVVYRWGGLQHNQYLTVTCITSSKKTPACITLQTQRDMCTSSCKDILKLH